MQKLFLITALVLATAAEPFPISEHSCQCLSKCDPPVFFTTDTTIFLTKYCDVNVTICTDAERLDDARDQCGYLFKTAIQGALKIFTLDSIPDWLSGATDTAIQQFSKLSGWTEENLQKIPASEFNKWNSSQFDKIPFSQQKKFTQEQIQHIQPKVLVSQIKSAIDSDQQVASNVWSSATADQIKEWDTTTWDYVLNARVIRGWTKVQLNSIPVDQIKKWPSDQISKIPLNEIAQFTKAQIAGLSPAGLNAKLIDAIIGRQQVASNVWSSATADQIKEWGFHAWSQLSENLDMLSTWSKAQIDAIPLDTVKSWTIAQLKKIPVDKISQYTKEQINAIPFDKLKELTKEQLSQIDLAWIEEKYRAVIAAIAAGNSTGNFPTTASSGESATPTATPTAVPTAVPTTAVPTAAPTTAVPTAVPTAAVPTAAVPTAVPTAAVPTTAVPTAVPTTAVPTAVPTTAVPTAAVPTAISNAVPTSEPVIDVIDELSGATATKAVCAALGLSVALLL